jgi:DNA mismatch repair ATPase MutS
LASTGAPVLFLLDELLSGTNSHDRAIGARGVLLGLLDRGALGMVTTHDLALTAIAEQEGARAANWHLEDTLIDGKLEFDYRLKPGVVRRSNALELMRAVGLEVRA